MPLQLNNIRNNNKNVGTSDLNESLVPGGLVCGVGKIF